MSSSDSGKPWWEGDYVWRPPQGEDVPAERLPPPPRQREWEREEEPPAPRSSDLVPCWRCGKRVEEGERTCPYCGASFAAERPRQRRDKPLRFDSGADGVMTMIWFFCALLGVSLLNGLFGIIMVRSGPVSNGVSLTLLLFVEGIDTILVLVALSMVRRPPAPPLVPASLQGLTWAFSLPILAGLLAANIAYHQILRNFLGGGVENVRFELNWLSPVMILLSCVQPAIIEELFFRHLALGTLRRQMNMHAAVLVSSIMFAAAHIHAPISMPLFTMLGIGFGYMRLASGSLILPMLMHFLHNLAVLFIAGPH